MKNKKTGRMTANVSDSDKEEFEEIAYKLGQTSAGLAAMLIESYLESKRKYGNQVFYPPKFHTFESIKIQEEIDSNSDLSEANGSIKQKAG
ncbi:hypothetical protein P4E94_19675 [Pontiellaceae bacterium B12219]|nr:hypothetical protein [Pontiellaceae bacterium B12219]